MAVSETTAPKPQLFNDKPFHKRQILYTRRAGRDGWLNVRLTQPKPTKFKHKDQMADYWPLAEYTKVEITREEGDWTYFVIADGAVWAGEEASLHTLNAHAYLSEKGPEQSAAQVNVRYLEKSTAISPYKGPHLQQWAELIAPGVTKARITINTFGIDDAIYSPIKPGRHLILSPDGTHMDTGNTARYAQDTKGMVGNDVWFPIGLYGAQVNSSRYIHVGHLSEGCVTCYQLDVWTPLYNYLISHRIPNSAGKLIGYLDVTK